MLWGSSIVNSFRDVFALFCPIHGHRTRGSVLVFDQLISVVKSVMDKRHPFIDHKFALKKYMGLPTAERPRRCRQLSRRLRFCRPS